MLVPPRVKLHDAVADSKKAIPSGYGGLLLFRFEKLKSSVGIICARPVRGLCHVREMSGYLTDAATEPSILCSFESNKVTHLLTILSMKWAGRRIFLKSSVRLGPILDFYSK